VIVASLSVSIVWVDHARRYADELPRISDPAALEGETADRSDGKRGILKIFLALVRCHDDFVENDRIG